MKLGNLFRPRRLLRLEVDKPSLQSIASSLSTIAEFCTYYAKYAFGIDLGYPTPRPTRKDPEPSVEYTSQETHARLAEEARIQAMVEGIGDLELSGGDEGGNGDLFDHET